MKSRRTKVAEAISEIRNRYAIGKEILRTVPKRGMYRDGTIEREAKKQGINPTTVRHLRKMADDKKGYSPRELNKLCNLIKEKQPDQHDGWAIVGISHIVRLLSVPKPLRKKLQRQAICRGWSVTELDVQIGKRCGVRTHGGRPPRIPRDLNDIYVQIEGRCESWRRWHAELTRLRLHIKKKKMPKEISELIVKAAGILGELQQTVCLEIKEGQPERKERLQFKEDSS